MKNPESKLQISCVNWFRLQYPNLYYSLFAIPNGQLRNVIIAAKLKKEGVLPGVADLFLSLPNNQYNGFYIEMKVKPNKPTEKQTKFLETQRKNGYKASVIYSFDQFKTEINQYLLNR